MKRLLPVLSLLSVSFFAQAGPAPAAPPSPGHKPVTTFTDPRLLVEWDRDASGPFSLAAVFRILHETNGLSIPKAAIAATDAGGTASTGELLAGFTPTWGEIARTLGADTERLIAELGLDWEKDITKTYVTSAAKTEIGKDKFHRGNGNVTRVFQEKWLTSPDGQFLLSGVVYRPDRRDFDTSPSCGELRFLYRLGYEVTMGGSVYASRMPFAVNVVYHVPDDGKSCRTVASAFTNAAADPKRLVAGPLDLAKVRFKQIELNTQLARFPSDLENVDGRKFAGQAVYWMRIFAIRDGKLVPVKLENTPDVQAIRKDPAKQKMLREFLAANLDAVDSGAFLLPDALLADIALSWSTLGSARSANKPFERLLSKKDADEIVAKAPKKERAFVGSGGALIERLDTSTCMGCHQSSSTAGFHFLGVDREFGSDTAAVKTATDGNRLQLAFSPHFYADSFRRERYLTQLASGAATDRTRPHPSAPPASWAAGAPGYGRAGANMPCVADASAPLAAASAWTCDEGLTCSALAANASLSFSLGQCVPAPEKIHAGLSCRSGSLRESEAPGAELLAYNVRSFKDRVEKEVPLYTLEEGPVKEAYNCRPSRIGVPLGRVTKSCSAEQRTLAGVTKESAEVCAIVGGKGFEEMAKGYFNSKRFLEGAGRGLLDACSSSRFCREDYICQQLPDYLGTPKGGVKAATLDAVRGEGVGFCTPTYFVYQLRLDGHPNPR